MYAGSLQSPWEGAQRGGPSVTAGWGDAAGADVGLRRSGSARIRVPPQQKAPRRAVSGRLTEHQPRQKDAGEPLTGSIPGARPPPLHLLRAPRRSEPGSALPPYPPAPTAPPGYPLEKLPALSGSFILSLPSSRHRPAASRGGAGGCSGRVPAGRLPRGVRRSSPARGGGGGPSPAEPRTAARATDTPQAGGRRLGGAALTVDAGLVSHGSARLRSPALRLRRVPGRKRLRRQHRPLPESETRRRRREEPPPPRGGATGPGRSHRRPEEEPPPPEEPQAPGGAAAGRRRRAGAALWRPLAELRVSARPRAGPRHVGRVAAALAAGRPRGASRRSPGAGAGPPARRPPLPPAEVPAGRRRGEPPRRADRAGHRARAGPALGFGLR